MGKLGLDKNLWFGQVSLSPSPREAICPYPTSKYTIEGDDQKLIEERMQATPAFAASEGTLFTDFDSVSAEKILNDDRLFREVAVQRSGSYVKEREKLSDRQTLFPDRQPPEVADYSIKATYGS